MGISIEQERRFYEDFYRRLLQYPDHALISNRGAFLRFFDDPSHPFYERRRLYRAALERLLAEPLEGISVLDYGCGPGDWGVLLATEGARVTLLDLSETAIKLGLRRARANAVSGRVRGVASDASDLGCFATGEFDLIFACAAVHHTLKYRNALDELVRILKPGGKLILAETYGNNRLLNLARRLRARLGGEPSEQGEEIIFGDREIELLRRHFQRVEVLPMNLLAMAKRLLRGRFRNPASRGLVRILEAVDSVLLRFFPALRRYCGEAVIVAVK